MVPARKRTLRDLLGISTTREKTDTPAEQADDAVDAALAHLALACLENKDAVADVKRRKSEGKLMRISSSRPPASKSESGD